MVVGGQSQVQMGCCVCDAQAGVCCACAAGDVRGRGAAAWASVRARGALACSMLGHHARYCSTLCATVAPVLPVDFLAAVSTSNLKS